MRVFIYEHLTGGGLLGCDGPLAEVASLVAEGRAISGALAADFSAVPDVLVSCLRDSRTVDWKPSCHRCVDVQTADERDAAFVHDAAEADWTVVIAPEIGGILAERCRRVIAGGGRLLGGSLPTIDLAGDKHATAEHLRAAGVSAPCGIPFQLGQPWPVDFSYPAVWKPRDGAGSQGLMLVESRDVPVPPADPRPGRLEVVSFATACGGPQPRYGELPYREADASRSPVREVGATPASVAFLCGPAVCVSLPPCSQRLGRGFRYLGGSLPLEPPMAERAARLARRAVATLPGPLGYIGVDLTLSAAEDGMDDVVIEINPRLTTSYIGLRAACQRNLAAAMLAIAEGRAYNLSFGSGVVEFAADGTVAK